MHLFIPLSIKRYLTAPIFTLKHLKMSLAVVADTDVSCIFMETCMLPCSSEGGTAVIIHWNQLSAGNLFVHSFYEGSDQLAVQNQHFRGRTSLFSDQISSGNASLLLTGVKVQDEGRYKCYTSTDNGVKESFINLKMDGMRHTMHSFKKINVFSWCNLSFLNLYHFLQVYVKNVSTYNGIFLKK